MTGEQLYTEYCRVFGTPFVPKWNGLSEESRRGWNILARNVTNEIEEPFTKNSYPTVTTGTTIKVQK